MIFHIWAIQLFLCLACTFTSLALPPANPKENFDSLVVQSQKLPDDSARVAVLLRIAGQLERINPDTAYGIMRQALSIAEEIGHADFRTNLRLRMANVMSVTGKLDSASALIYAAIRIAEATGNGRRLGQAYQTLGMNAGMAGDIEGAIFQTKKALRIYDSLNIEASIFPTVHNIMVAYGYLQELDSAEVYFHRAQRYLDDHYVFNARSGSYAGIAAVYRQVGNYEMAKNYFKKALEYNEDTANSYGIGSFYAQVGANFRLGGYPDSALVYFKKQLEVHRDINSLPGITSALKDISITYEELEDFAHAVEFYKQYDVMRDSFLDEKKVESMQELEIEYETEKRQQENAMLAKTAELQSLQLSNRNNLIYILLLAVVLLATIGYLVFSNYRYRTQRRELQLESKMLRSQMNPHFVFNALSSIQHLVYNNEKLFAITNISVFAKLMRRVLEQSTEESIPLEEEIESLELYLKLESLRFDGRFTYQMNVADDLVAGQLRVPPLFLQPFVENAIKHGLLNKKPSGGKLDISFTQEQNILVCTIHDDGVGRERANQIKTTSGVEHQSYSGKSTQRRAELLNKGQKQKISIEIIDLYENEQPAGTKVVTRFPQR